MSLQVWLPLNDDLHNQGLMQLPNLTTNTFTLQTDGKIGKCYSGQGIYHLTNDTILNNEWSLCAWVKASSWGQYNDIILCKNSSTSTECQFYFSIVGGNKLNVGINGGSSTDSYSYTFATNTWYHIAATYNGTTYTLYLNGEQKKTGTYSSTKKTGMNNLGIGCRSSDTNGTTGSGHNSGMKLNDVRIYDHALSAKEVEEIAKGLVLHYQLNDPYIESTTNLFKPKPCTGGENWIASGNGVKIDWAANAKDTYWYLQLADGVTLVRGDTYTFSCRCSGIGTTTVMFRWCNSAGYDIYLHNGWNQYTFSMPSRNITHPFLDDVNRDASLSNLQIYDFQLEKKGYATPYTSSTRNLNIIYDSSGYNNNGTIIGSLETTTPSPRYSCAILFTKGRDEIQSNLNPNFITTGSISLWVKVDSLGSSGWLPFTGDTTGKYLLATSNGTGNFYNGTVTAAGTIKYYEDGNQVTAPTGLTTGWHHIVITGINLSSWTTLHINNYGGVTATAWNSTVKYSDIRFYNTILTAAQIKELYNTSMTIDNQGNIRARELVE